MVIETSASIGSVALAEGPELLRERIFTGKLRHAGELLPTMAQLTEELQWQPGDIEQVYVSVGPGSFTGLRIAITAVKTLGFALGQVKIVAVPSTEALALNAFSAAQEQNLNLKYVGVVIDAKRSQIYTALYEAIDPCHCGSDGSVQSPGRQDGTVQSPSGKDGGVYPPILPRGLGDNTSSEGICQTLAPGFRVIMEPAVMRPEELRAKNHRPLCLLGEGIKFHREKLTGESVTFLDDKYAQPRAGQVHRCGWLRAQAGVFTDIDELVPFYLRRPEAVERWEKLHGKY
jgi:tRNA threonylcarbamoyl adenosine modification protein YeaZ